MQYIWVNGVDQGQNKFLRVPPNNNPVTDVTSKDITCNVNGLSGANVQTVSIPAGTNVRRITSTRITRVQVSSVCTFSRSPSSGTSTTSVRVRTPSPADTRAPSRSSSPRRRQPPRPSTARALSGPRSTLLVSSTPSRSSGLLM